MLLLRQLFRNRSGFSTIEYALIAAVVAVAAAIVMNALGPNY